MSAEPRYWQISAGDDQREYAKDFLDFGIAFVGKEKPKLTAMRAIAVGDRIILKRGMSEIISVGEVVERDGCHRGENDKDWLRDFDGWDLPAYCYVNWRKLPGPIGSTGLTRGTIRGVNQLSLRAKVEALLQEHTNHDRKPEPPMAEEVSDEEMLFFLVRQGLRPSVANELTATLSRIRLLARYYYDCCRWEDVREHETRTFLVIPLLLALGWAEQQLKIELGTCDRGRIDIACFARAFSADGPNDCRLIVETKGFSQGLVNAPDQVKRYAASFPECQVVLVTNGYCYKAFNKMANGRFSEEPCAYLNLLRPRNRYRKAAPESDGCLEILRLLLPNA